MKKCSNCDYSTNNTEINYCPKCGSKLIEPSNVCVVCGKDLPADAVFCGYCGTNVKSAAKVQEPLTKKPANPKKRAHLLLGLKIAGICVLFVGFFLILLSLFFSWINTNTSETVVFINLRNNYDVFSLNYDIYNFNSTIFGSIGTLLSFVNVFIELQTWTIGTILSDISNLIPLTITIITQFLTLIFLIIVLTISIITVSKHKPFFKSGAKSFLSILIFYLIAAAFIGDLGPGLILGIFTSLFCSVTFKVFEYLSLEKRPSIVSLIPNIIGSVCVIVVSCLVYGLLRDSFTRTFSANIIQITNYTGFGKFSPAFPLIFIDNELSSMVIVAFDAPLLIKALFNVIFFLLTLIFLLTFIAQRLNSILDKVSTKNKVIGWISVGLLIVFAISNLVFYNTFYSQNPNIIHTFGTTIAIIIFLVLGVVSSHINIKTPATAKLSEE